MNKPSLDPDLLMAFVAVAEHRSFTRAAVLLNRTQSAVSMQIKRLEDRLGVALFNRTKANVDLSPAGEGLLGYARRTARTLSSLRTSPGVKAGVALGSTTFSPLIWMLPCSTRRRASPRDLVSWKPCA